MHRRTPTKICAIHENSAKSFVGGIITKNYITQNIYILGNLTFYNAAESSRGKPDFATKLSHGRRPISHTQSQVNKEQFTWNRVLLKHFGMNRSDL